MLGQNITSKTLTLPKIGLGTHQLRGMACTRAVNFALSIGYRYIDTSPSYSNEHMISLSLDRVPRDSLFLSSKITYSCQGHSRALSSVTQSLERLGAKYLDLCVIEWPGARDFPNESPQHALFRHETWRVLESLKAQGTVRHIGVANFEISHLRKLMDFAVIRPEVNYVEVHPLLSNRPLVEFCQENEILVVAHTPLGKKSGKIWDCLDLAMISKKHKVEISQVILNWTLSKGIAVVPRSQDFTHIRVNSMLDFQLDEDDIKRIDALNIDFRVCKGTNNIL